MYLVKRGAFLHKERKLSLNRTYRKTNEIKQPMYYQHNNAVSNQFIITVVKY